MGVIHDWGSPLGFNWAYNNPDKVKGIAYMEAVVKGFDSADFSQVDGDQEFLALFSAAKTPGVGEQLWLEGETNAMVEGMINLYPQFTEDDKSVYRAPYLTPGEGRRATLALPRDVPIDGEPAEVFAIIEEYSKWLTKTNIPKLLVVAEPGLLLFGPYLDYARTFPNQEEVTVTGGHYVQEDSPAEIAKAIEDWVGAMVEEDASSEGVEKGEMAKEVSVEDDAISSAHNNVASMLKLFVVSALAVYFF